MSRCYIDTNFLYLHLRSPHDTAPEPVAAWRARAISEIEADGGVISALVLDELAYRLVLAWLRDDGEADPLTAYRSNARAVMQSTRQRLAETWRVVDLLALELQPTDYAVVEQAKALMAEPGLSPRDAFHAAHALAARCEIIISSDKAFKQVPGLRQLGPG